MVLLKGLENGQFVFFTNYNSRKGQDIAENNFAALTFFWPALERQVRIEGEIMPVSEISRMYILPVGPGAARLAPGFRRKARL